MLSITRAIRSLDESEGLAKNAGELLADLIRDDQRYPVEIDAKATGRYRNSLDAILGRIGDSPDDTVRREVRLLIRDAKRDHKLESEGFLSGLRSQLSEAAAVLNQMIASLASGTEDRHVRVELKRLAKLSQADDIQAIRIGINEVVATLERALDDLKRQSELKVAELQGEIQTLHKRIKESSSASAVMPGTADVCVAVQSAIAADRSFSLIFVALRNLPTIRAAYGGDLAKRTVEAATKRLESQVGPEAVTGEWELGIIASLELGDQNRSMDVGRAVSSQMEKTYMLPEGSRSREVNLRVSTGIVQRKASEPPRQTEKRIEELLRLLHGDR